MRPDILILGQGLAGTLLAWELERAGVSFAIVDQGHAVAATMAAAGIINPITGRRLVKSWRVDALLPAARSTYQEIEHACGLLLWREMRVHRRFAEERERAAFLQKRVGGELAPFAADGDDDGFWINGAAHVDLQRLIATARERWRRAGRMRQGVADVAHQSGEHACVIDCTGLAAARGAAFGFVPWEFSKGERLELDVSGLPPDVIVNSRHWVLPVAEGVAWVGATHVPAVVDATPTSAARATLEASAAKLLARPFRVVGQRAGVRVALPDRRPVAGRHPDNPRLGLINGLGGKGALWAPMLARAWASHLVAGAPFEPEIDVRRFR